MWSTNFKEEAVAHKGSRGMKKIKKIQQLLVSVLHALPCYRYKCYTTHSDTCKPSQIVRTYHLRIMLVWLRRIVLNKSPSTTTSTTKITNLFVYVYTHRLIAICFFVCFSASVAQHGLWPPRTTRFRDHTLRRATVGRTPLDEWSARRRDLYLTTLTTDKHPCPRWVSNPR
jgi:hypothetical protein